MPRMTNFAIITLSVSFLYAGQAAQPTALERARTAVDLVLSSSYDELVALFSPELRSMVSAEKLRSGLQPVLRSLGTVQERLDPAIQAAGERSVVTLPIRFERATWEFIVTVNRGGDLAGLFARPSSDGSVPWAAPSYSKAGSFRTEEVTIGKGQWQLPGTLALPLGKVRALALVLVHGSGPNDRDETIGPQKPFRDLAEGLASHGIAVLRYEKRTRYAAAKLGSLKNFTVQDETVDDALAAVEFLRGRSEIDPARVFVLGHSLGGYLMPRIGQRDANIAGMILLAGSARPLEDLIVEQSLYLASLHGDSPEVQGQLKKVKADAERVKALGADAGPASGGMLFTAPPSYWLDLKGYDPAKEARGLRQPMLILQGERDYQVTMTDFGLWKDALRDRPNVTFRSFPALNHLFQAGEGKSTPAEYTIKPGHVEPEVIEVIGTWIAGIAS